MMTSQNSKETSAQVKAAIIGGIFVLLAALITGIFLILNTMVEKGAILVDIPTADPYAKGQIRSTIRSLAERGLLSSTNGSVLWSVQDYQVTTLGQGYETAFPSDVDVADFVLFGELNWSAESEKLPFCGFTFRGDQSGEGNFYTTFLGLDKEVTFWVHSGEDYLPFSLKVKADSATSTNNKLLLIAYGSEFTLLVNDVVAYQTSESTFSSGRVGLSAGVDKESNVCSFINAWLWRID